MNYHILLRDGKAFAQPICPDCEGGIIIDIIIEPDCCLQTLDAGYCCGNPFPIETQVQKQCPRCQATGFIDNAVPFKDYHEEHIWLYCLKEGVLIACPEGYRIEIEGEHATLKELKG